MLEELVKHYNFLKALDEEVLTIIEENLVLKKVEAGEVIVAGEQVCWGFSFIKSGSLRVYALNEEGREVTLYRLSRGDSCFMTIICSLKQVHPNACVRVEEDSELLILPINLFEKYLMNHPVYLQFIFKNLYGKFLTVVETLETITFKSIEQRMIDYLNTHSKVQVLYKTHEEIAFDIGTTREVVSRCLKSLERKGKVKLERGKIKLMDEL